MTQLTRRPRERLSYPDPVTPAEARVLEKLRLGLTNAEIGTELRLSTETVKYHAANMLSKLGLDGRRGLAAREPGRESVPAGGWWATALVALKRVAARTWDRPALIAPASPGSLQREWFRGIFRSCRPTPTRHARRRTVN